MPLQTKKVKYRYGFKKWTDETVIGLRKELGLFASSPLCAFELCKHLGIPILEPSNVQNLPQDKLDELLGKGAKHWSAVTIPLDNENYIIIHNPSHSPARQQSNLMHEIAHILCKHKVSDEIKETGLAGFLRNFDIEQENEAEWLGSSLQLPRPALLYSLKRNMTVEEIAEHYNCSVDMVQYRINITGVKKQLKYLKY